MIRDRNYPELVIISQLSRITQQLTALVLQELDSSTGDSGETIANQEQQIGYWLVELGRSLGERATQRRDPQDREERITRHDVTVNRNNELANYNPSSARTPSCNRRGNISEGRRSPTL
jgi:hypothetical protein